MPTCGDIIRLVPGPRGARGSDANNGADGASSFTALTAAMTMPAELANVTVSVADATGFASGETVYVQGAGYMEVQSIPSSIQMVLKNLESAASRAYAGNVAPGTVIAIGNKIVAGGVQGPAGFLFYALYQHQLASGSFAGTFTTGAWRTVPLNTEVADTGGDGTLAANQVLLKSGTYRARWRSCGYQVGDFQSRLFNVDTGTTIASASNARSAVADSTPTYSIGEARFTLSADQTIRIEARCGATKITDGFGTTNSTGDTEVWASLELQKEG